MRLFIATAFAATAFALPAAAAPKSTETVRELYARGCTVQQVHTPAGKIVTNAPIVRCPTGSAQLSKAQAQPRTGMASATAN